VLTNYAESIQIHINMPSPLSPNQIWNVAEASLHRGYESAIMDVIDKNHETPDNVRPFTAHLILAFESLLTFKGLSLCLWQWLTHMIFQYPPPYSGQHACNSIGLYGSYQDNSWLTRHFIRRYTLPSSVSDIQRKELYWAIVGAGSRSHSLPSCGTKSSSKLLVSESNSLVLHSEYQTRALRQCIFLYLPRCQRNHVVPTTQSNTY